MFANIRLCVFFVLIIPILSHGECINDHDKITVTGELFIQDFPGPPNFEDISNGDKKVRVLMLHVDSSTRLDCVIDTYYSEDKINSNSKEEGWNEFMELIPEGEIHQYNRFIGSRVSITGHVFLAASPYHYTPVLISDILSLKKIPKK
ncbi:DUF4431 domain-containing protein [Salmonella enterica]|uniref:DUF4431 domain-containing protein n=1 Tax=Salmonella enterica TaxID=28901 RepID=UPI0010105116|nr:DUF4431 domain-containing protein [Salmonella enterica]RXO32061.1 DUF4431 domain-containing protein [Salmonella enterica]